MPGWKSPIKGCNKFSELPENAQKYVLKTEELLGVPGKMKKKLLQLVCTMHAYSSSVAGLSGQV
jgi:adenylosuccinate synthase